MMKKRWDPMAAAWGLLFLIFAVFAFLYPYSGDDWTWGSAVGMERLHDGSPVKDRLKERYLMFHGLDETATLEFVSRQELDAMIRAED